MCSSLATIPAHISKKYICACVCSKGWHMSFKAIKIAFNNSYSRLRAAIFVGSGDPVQSENEIRKCHIPHLEWSFCNSEQPCLMSPSAFHQSLFYFSTKDIFSPLRTQSCFLLFFFKPDCYIRTTQATIKLMHILWKSTSEPVKHNCVNS